MLYNITYQDIQTWYVIFPVLLAIILIAFSLGHLYLASFPDTKGGQDSLFYFKSVGSSTEQNYVDSFIAKSDHDIEKDLLGQIWRNSQILKDKFLHIEKAYRLSLWSILPWTVFLVASSIVNSRMPMLG
ncbi:MAG: Pycsar system effector family protein [Sphingomonadales bacterium]|jgi:hypothetical protein